MLRQFLERLLHLRSCILKRVVLIETMIIIFDISYLTSAEGRAEKIYRIYDIFGKVNIRYIRYIRSYMIYSVRRRLIFLKWKYFTGIYRIYDIFGFRVYHMYGIFGKVNISYVSH